MCRIMSGIHRLLAIPLTKTYPALHIKVYWTAMVERQDLSPADLYNLAVAFRVQGYNEQADRIKEEANRRYRETKGNEWVFRL